MSTDTLGLIIEKGLEGINRYYSIYRAIVLSNEDSDNSNGLLLWMPEVLGGIKQWAYPRHQYGSLGCGIKGLTPQVGDTVYVTFEYGDASKPLWEYHGWARGEAPIPLNNPLVGGFITPNGNRVIYNEEDNTLDVYFNGQVFIHGKGETVVTSDSSVTIKGGAGVVINDGANGGQVNIQELTQKLNQLVQELEQVKAELNLHTHTGNSGSPTSPPLTPITKTFTPFVAEDYEDEKALH